MKKRIVIWLEPQELNELKRKASDEIGIRKGYVSHFISMVATKPILFLNKKLLKAIRESTK